MGSWMGQIYIILGLGLGLTDETTWMMILKLLIASVTVLDP